MNNENKSELLTRLSNLIHDIRFAKEQQWKTVYYALLLFSALIAISLGYDDQLNRPMKILFSVITVIASFAAFSYQIFFMKRLKLYRESTDVIDGLLGSGIKEEIARRRRSPDPTTEELNRGTIWLYTIPFLILIILGVAVVFTVVWKEELQKYHPIQLIIGIFCHYFC